MITVEHAKINKIPILHVVKQNLRVKKLPFIIFLHGFTSRKEFNLHYAYLLAEKGFRVILPDALYHGERAASLTEKQLDLHFWEIIIQTIKELDILKRFFEAKNLIDPARIGVVGTSMGGIITFGALTQYSWIKVAVSLMGMPYYEQFAINQIKNLRLRGVSIPLSESEKSQLLTKLREFDLSVHPEKLRNRPMLFWHGKKDPVVPYAPDYQFYETIKPLYHEHSERLKFISDENAGHKVSTDGVIQTVKWFESFL
ncbi:alpha/beta fold hydrolase [Cytobacillus depressus]|uniref:Alpha/beta fold hydrolase n=1 Tax=Cytobacillus depressus TaxID=1602942 RepID=A0A6L3V8R6_9BACI|nr:alpha/beta fold hydrolase [Cytobacillus depressus]KAB2337185.1 alpha/beta fold hydrolase [Cytobacillus depressus]